MRILRNYILKEFFGFFLLSLGLLTFLMIMGNLIKIANLIISKGVEISGIIKLFSYLIPYLLTYTIPISTLTGILLTFGRLSGDNEIIAIRTSGINIIYIILPVMIIGLMLSLFLIILNDSVIPYTHYASRRAFVEIGVKNPAAFLEAGTFIDAFQNYIIFIYNIQDNKLFNIRIYELQTDNRPPRTIVAKKGEFVSIPEKSIVKLKLVDGTSDEPDPNNPYNFYKLNFKTYFINLNLSNNLQMIQKEKKPKDMNFMELKQKVQEMKKMGIDPTVILSHLQERIALSFSCFVFTVIGAALGLITRSRKKTINLSIASLIVGIYYMLLLGSEALSINGFIHPQIGMWLPNIIIGTTGIFLLSHICAY
ncbi:MAG: LptF/LptG family permease [Candidatus Omnitrophica bacterium]|nr:LptF/LptG family permease [Candidatus Omnitrophota bacterium]